jgi:2-oxoglutarate ferredoxin oxidoreductase subunit alpha
MKKQLMKGNEAMAESAVRAGCRFYSGYPITPQTEILEYLYKRLEEVDGKCVQTESEIAGVNMLLGAVAAGVRGLTSSSSPGFALCQEGISYLAGYNLPAVLINVSRRGPGLGDLPVAQGDYWQMTKGGGNGDYRTLVLAPASVQEAADLTYESFDLAEKYLHPVLILADAAIGQMAEAVSFREFKGHDVDNNDFAVRGCRHGDTPHRVYNTCYKDEAYDKNLYNLYQTMYKNEQKWEAFCIEDAEIILVAYGVSSRICKEAVKIARERGLKIGLIRPITLWPFPDKAFASLGNNVKGIISVEISALGQMVDDIKLACNCRYQVHLYGTYFDVPDVEAIIEKAQTILSDSLEK